jgi:glycosyltransferase involved in cell wall biosynthesis
MPGRRAPTNRAEAEPVADWIRTSPFFDANAYTERLGPGLDPAIHYVVIGELLGWNPSRKFDPAFYLERYDDVARNFVSPLDHYSQFGQYEGRRAIPAASRLEFPALPDHRRPAVLLVVHDASRTGAPALGWEISRRLAESYQVVSVLMRGGTLEEHFKAVSAATVGPMVWEDWHPIEMKRIAERLVASYGPLYAIANSIETHAIVPALAKLGVPSVALVHEFAAYTRPLGKMRDVVDWATHIVFPAHVVAQSSFAAFPALTRRHGVHVLSQGLVELAANKNNEGEPDASGKHEDDIARRVRPEDAADAFVVLGVGSVQIRKGVDLFLTTAATVRRLAPELRFRFVWIGDGYDPVADSAYSVYLAEQIVRANLVETVAVLDAVDDLDPAFANADFFFMSSRLDPQPNVGVNAMIRGLPTVCFEGACGTAEILGADSETRSLVVPYMDAHAAAEAFCRLARDRTAWAAMGKAVARVGRAAYDMDAYVRRVDSWGKEAAAALSLNDLQTLRDANVIDAELALPCGAIAPGALGVERHVLQQWSVVRTSLDQTANPHFRRPCPGFHPQAYAQAHAEACVKGTINPLAHWLRAGRPKGLWSRPVFSPLDTPHRDSLPIRVALHAHFFFVLSARDLATRLAGNETPCDLLLSTDSETKAAYLRCVFAEHRGAVVVRVTPNRGRDVGALLTGFRDEIAPGAYDVLGHVHGKQSHDATMGNLWREFLWENLIGGMHPMLDRVVRVFANRSDLGLIVAEDPHLVGWDENRAIAERLAERMGVQLPLDDFFDFPLGNMFWARPLALQPLLALDLSWEDYPTEPVAPDGTLIHALERLVPYAVRQVGLSVAGVRVPGTTW